jgi:hypothetical protein
MRIRGPHIPDHFRILSVILRPQLEITLLNNLLIEIQLTHIRPRHTILLFNKLRQPLLQQIFQMLSIGDFVLISLIFLVFLFLKLLRLFFLCLLKLCLQIEDLVVLLEFSGLGWDELLLAFLRGWVRIQPIGEVCDGESRPLVKYLGKPLTDDMTDLGRRDLLH